MKDIFNMSAVGIIASADDPAEVFMEMKTGSLTIPSFKWTLCPFGGNWIGESARHDGSPKGTFLREIGEEFALRPFVRDWADLNALGLSGDVPGSGASITSEDQEKMTHVREEICRRTEPWGDYLVPTSARVMNMVPGTASRSDILTLVSYHVVLLPADVWTVLKELQGKFETLSTENESCILSLMEIVAMERRFAWGHESAYIDFWTAMGLGGIATHVRRFPHDPAQHIGPQRSSYEEYSQEYLPQKRP